MSNAGQFAGQIKDDGGGMEPVQQQRRQFIIAAAAVAGVSLALKVPAIPPLSDVLALVDAGSDLFAKVLKALGHGVDVDRRAFESASLDLHLTRILRTPQAALASQALASTGDLKRRILENIEADYRAGAIRVVNGWWLSDTEANCLELIDRLRAV